jgi:hypothetical protein
MLMIIHGRCWRECDGRICVPVLLRWHNNPVSHAMILPTTVCTGFCCAWRNSAWYPATMVLNPTMGGLCRLYCAGFIVPTPLLLYCADSFLLRQIRPVVRMRCLPARLMLRPTVRRLGGPTRAWWVRAVALAQRGAEAGPPVVEGCVRLGTCDGDL